MIKFIDFEIKTGAENMQTDSDLLNFAIQNELSEPIFRLYGWSPACISLGRNQNDDFLDRNFLKSQNIDIVRRLTGGRALLHDKELTYSYIVPVSTLINGQSVVGSYKEISQILIDGFDSLGIKLEFGKTKCPKSNQNFCMTISTGADLCFEGKKLIGSAQFRKQGYILQHGSILFDYDKELIEKIFPSRTDENALTCLKVVNPNLNSKDVEKALLTNLRADIQKN